MKLITAIILVGLFVLAGVLSGCAGLGQGMSAAELTAASKDKSISATCSNVSGIYGTFATKHVVIDAQVIRNGKVSVDDKCTVEMATTMGNEGPKK